MERNYYVKVIKEEYVRDTYIERVLAKFKSINEAVKYVEEIAGARGFKRIYDGATEYTFARGDEYIFLEESEDRVYETFDEYMRVFNNLSEIKDLLDQKGIEASHYGDELNITYTLKKCFQVNGDVTKECVDKLLYERTGYRICE